MTPLCRLRVALARVRQARELHRAAPACAAKAGAPRDPDAAEAFAPWGGGDDATPREDERKADGAPEAQDADFEAGGKPPKSTVEKARDVGGGLAGVEAASQEAGARALETGEDTEREALRKAASEAIQQGELARPAVERLMTQQASELGGVVGAAVHAAQSVAGAVHHLGSRAVDAALDRAADAIRPTFEVVGRAAEAADDRPGRSKEDMAARGGGDGPAVRDGGKPEEEQRRE